jgi:hypothetical protein
VVLLPQQMSWLYQLVLVVPILSQRNPVHPPIVLRPISILSSYLRRSISSGLFRLDFQTKCCVNFSYPMRATRPAFIFFWQSPPLTIVTFLERVHKTSRYFPEQEYCNWELRSQTSIRNQLSDCLKRYSSNINILHKYICYESTAKFFHTKYSTRRTDSYTSPACSDWVALCPLFAFSLARVRFCSKISDDRSDDMPNRGHALRLKRYMSESS